MCGILGVSFQEGSTVKNEALIKSIVKSLFEASMERGYDATGIAYVNGNKIIVVKDNIRASLFVRSEEFIKSCEDNITFPHGYMASKRLVSIIGHCRMETKGSHTIRHNNHPIIADNIIGVHNGIISNDDSLFACYDLPRKGRVDSEIIFRLINHFINSYGTNTPEAIIKTTSLIYGSFACAFVSSRNPYMLWLFRNNSPTTVYNYPKTGMIAFASSKDYLDGAIAKYEQTQVGEPKEIKFPINHGMGINLFTRSIYRFRLTEVGIEGCVL